jgi:putative ATP-dependent endonuclease of the OLD family
MKVKRFGVLNYRSYGHLGGGLDLFAVDLPLHSIDFAQDIIVVVGENNVGKTNLMTAYRDFRNAGFVPDIEDFFDCDASGPMVMEIAIESDTPDELNDSQVSRWFESGTKIARVRKVWTAAGQKAQKYSFDPEKAGWVEGGFGGFDQILQSQLPEPVHIRPDMTAEEIRGEFQKLFKDIIQRYISKSEHAKAVEAALAALVEEIESDQFVQDIADRVRNVAADIFPNLKIEIRNPTSDKGVGSLLDKTTNINLSVADSPSLHMSRHGQGSQRVFMLSALSALAGELAAVARKTKTKGDATSPSGGKLIQIEEPELYLSPTAVRRMRDLIYTLGAQEGVQVMACTHSPLMVDFSRPKQTIVLVV